MRQKKSRPGAARAFLHGVWSRYKRGYMGQHPVIRFFLWALIVLAVSVLGWKFFFSSYQKLDLKPSVTVVVAPVIRGNIPVYVAALGSVTPTDNVTVKTQIDGLLLRFLVEEGQTIKEGELLAEIDSRLYQAQLLQYEGQLLRDNALLENAKLDLERYQALYAQQAVSKQILDTQVWLVKQYEGNVITDQGLIETAKVNISYCHITAPITGRVGLRQVDPGNYVQTTDPNGIIVLNALSPITVVFSVPEDSIQAILERISSNNLLTVEAYDRWQNKLLAKSNSVVIDNLIDVSTGTLKLKARYDNKGGQLFPNQFVNIQLLLKILHDVIVVPTAAVQHGAQGPFVFVLAKDQTVHVKPVFVTVTHKDQTAIIGKVTAGEFVVVEGTDKLADGMLVKATSHPSDPPATQTNQAPKGIY
jgi:membrane fusion protein, multidrug efflux system